MPNKLSLADLRQYAGGAWDAGRAVAHRPKMRPERASARLTWFTPGTHRLALTGAECDAIVAGLEPTTGTWKPGTYSSLVSPILEEAVWHRVAEAVAAANAAWWRLDGVALTELSALRYLPGDLCRWHTDWAPQWPDRSLSAVVMLSAPEDFEGGQLQFNLGALDLESDDDETPFAPPMAKGTICVFPAHVLHRATTVIAGERTILAAFLNRQAG